MGIAKDFIRKFVDRILIIIGYTVAIILLLLFAYGMAYNMKIIQ